MSENKSEILQGTLDLMVLKTLDILGPLHGYGLARRIEQISEEMLQINQGTIYLCLVRLLQKKWIQAEWGASENSRRARFYSITNAGRKQLIAETEAFSFASSWVGCIPVRTPNIGVQRRLRPRCRKSLWQLSALQACRSLSTCPTRCSFERTLTQSS